MFFLKSPIWLKSYRLPPEFHEQIPPSCISKLCVKVLNQITDREDSMMNFKIFCTATV